MLPKAAYEQTINNESSRATYSAVIADFVPAATATDMVILAGGGKGKIITLTNVRISGSATASTYQGFYLFKRTALDTGGTSTATPIVIHDSTDPASVGVVSQYSANPAGLGAGILLRADHIGLPAPASAAASAQASIWDFADRGAKAPKLMNATESFCLNFNGAAVPAGANLHITLEWAEE